MNTVTSCTGCVFFDNSTKQTGSADAGVCRFNPPAPQAGTESKSLWPVVTSADWCGHFTAQRAAAHAA